MICSCIAQVGMNRNLTVERTCLVSFRLFLQVVAENALPFPTSKRLMTVAYNYCSLIDVSTLKIRKCPVTK